VSIATPDWLRTRGGEIRGSKDAHSWTVYLRGEPNYMIEPLPAQGKFCCRVTQTNNGRRFESTNTYASKDAAAHGGLDDLRKALGW